MLLPIQILVLSVIKRSRHKKCFSELHSRFVCVESPHSLVPRSFGFLTQTTHECNPVRGTFCDLNYILKEQLNFVRRKSEVMRYISSNNHRVFFPREGGENVHSTHTFAVSRKLQETRHKGPSYFPRTLKEKTWRRKPLGFAI